ncbi:hypothetical protein MXMO3_03494 (plasmid) [Maritalea myrionectae]|uniref:Uncharacterized protein n=1 Tax=Maritalea myrionectae TaxID=454601 RepID=A0A2R4MJ29_9HYPH|nr:helix-turn-helix domain-containing protein [Maritalea myrionectae]AVX05997.1 hypothetical protein MXMO3_03494 [Maritalea myrionectae]
MRPYPSTIAPNYKSAIKETPSPVLPGQDLLSSLESSYEAAKRRIKTRFTQSQMAKMGYKKPQFGSRAYMEFMGKGVISPEEAQADALLAELRAERTGQRKDAMLDEAADFYLKPSFPVRRNTPLRWARQEPIASDQYAPNMATTAARDERLTPNAKALLQIIHARCATEGITETTKATLANIMNRSTRTIQRYIADLVQFGYLICHTKRNGRGLYVGLVMRVAEKTKPFYHDLKRTADLIAPLLKPGRSETDQRIEVLEETSLSPKKRFKFNKRADILSDDIFH